MKQNYNVNLEGTPGGTNTPVTVGDTGRSFFGNFFDFISKVGRPAAAILMFLLISHWQATAQVAAQSGSGVPKSIYDFKVAASKGGTIDFNDFKGKKILIVNTPINADNSYQYKELEALYQKYKDKLVIVGFLSQDFLVPPGSHQEENPAGKNYHVTFPLAAKTVLRGPDAAPIYQWLTDVKYNNYKTTGIKFDFQKYLISDKGELIAEFDPKIRASNPGLIAAIEN